MAKSPEPNAGPLPQDHAARIAQKLSDGHLALFVGAGLSHLAPAKDGSDRRLPLWMALTRQVAAACHEDPADYGDDPLDLFDAVVYGQERYTLEQAVRDALDDRPFDPAAAHHALAGLPWASVLTTNYDSLLDRVFGEKPVFEEQDYDRLALRQDKVPRLFALHGTLERPHTLTRDDYRLWADQHPRAFAHLKQLILEKTVLFVGYSLSDPHLDSLLALVRAMTRGREKRLYAWMWRLPEGKAKLLDRRDKIEAVSLEGKDAWAAAFGQLKDALATLGEPGAVATAPVVADPYAYERAQYVAAIEARYGVANLQGLYQWGAGYARDDVRLSEIFVEPDLETSKSLRAHRSDPDDDGTSGAETELETLGQALKDRESDRSVRGAEGRSPASRVKDRETRLLVVGAPGQGKSTLLRHWLLDAAMLWRDQPKARPLPVYVRLSDWEAERGPPEGRLRTYIRARLPLLAEIGGPAVDDWLAGPVLWLLDGVDEVRDPHERERLREEIQAIAQQRAGDRWVVATRPAGEPAVGLAPGWARAELPALSDRQIEDVLARWGQVLAQKEGLALDHRAMAQSLRKDTGLRDLRGNALLLTLAVLFYKSRRRLPDDRWEFYDAAEEALRDAWVRHRGRHAGAALPGDYLPTLLEQLALAGMREGQVFFSRERLERETRALLTSRGYTGGEQDRETGLFLRAAQDLIGVLIEQGPERFGFLHLTFQEFYAARALVKRSGEAPAVIRRFWDHPDWKELWPLYALGVQSDPSRYEALFEIILSDEHPLDSHLHRGKRACLRLAGLGPTPSPEPVKDVVRWAQAVLCERGSLLFEILASLSGWERSLPSDLREALLARLGDEDWLVRSAAVGALSGSAGEASVREALLARLGDESSSVRSAAVGALERAISAEKQRREDEGEPPGSV
ncbi:MAG: SIR2 family protein [Kiloniellales bacterium]|nr:SIR2 family protein [Kiloniellales bacterium]